MTVGKDYSNVRSQETSNIFHRYEKLGTDEKLALLYYIYKKMGKSITPAAPNAADLGLTSALIEDYFNLSDSEQLEIMRDIVNCKDTEYSHAYGGLTPNNQLLIWYVWAEAMGDKVVDMPSDYKATETINNVLSEIEKVEFEEQISILREIASTMGYSQVKRVNSRDEVGTTPSL